MGRAVGASEKAEAAFHPDDEYDTGRGEDPGPLPSFMDRAIDAARPNGRSGAAVVLDSYGTLDKALEHGHNLQAAVNELRVYIDGKHTVGAVEIRNLLERHRV